MIEIEGIIQLLHTQDMNSLLFTLLTIQLIVFNNYRGKKLTKFRISVKIHQNMTKIAKIFKITRF